MASPTFSLPEYIGGVRNWWEFIFLAWSWSELCRDYRYSWIRDSSFTLYALIRLGFTEEANGLFLSFSEISFTNNLHSQLTSNSSLNAFATRILMEVCRSCIPFMVSHLVLRHHNIDLTLSCITGGKDLEEVELLHLDGHKGSRPIRVGNGAADHVQLVRHLLTSVRWDMTHLYCWMYRIFTVNCASEHLMRYVYSFGEWSRRRVLIIPDISCLLKFTVKFFRMDCIYLGQKVSIRLLESVWANRPRYLTRSLGNRW